MAELTSAQLSRRDVLQLSAGLGLSVMLPGIDSRAAERRDPDRAKSLIVLWMGGGPSQMETWDPHPESKLTGETKAIKTSLPGLQVGSLFPQMAEQMQHMSVIRSLVSKEGDHERGTYFLKTGWRIDPSLRRPHPSIGAILTAERPDPNVEIPMHFSLGPSQWPGRGGFIGDQYDAFKVFQPGQNLRNLKSRVPAERQQQRLASLDVVTKAFSRGRRLQMRATRHEDTIQRAIRMMSSKQLEAFDLSTAPAELAAAYGDTRFGRGCMVAARLIGKGVRAVEVTLNGFDTHADNFNGHATQAEILDPAFATLIQDLRRNKLFDSTVVLCIGEFGRTPNINKLEGRDHWPHWFSCVIGGGGFKSGLVIGETNPELPEEQQKKGKGVKDAIRVEDLLATVYSRFGVDPQGENYTAENRPMRIVDGSPIERLI